MPTGRARKGDWCCGGCRHTNFGSKGYWKCQRCGASIKEGLHAYGDDTVNRAQQQIVLLPRN
eukprot:14235990-Heterocapsa_arctica.AAC.1